MPLIQCGDHSYAPAVIICTHLYEGTSHSWCPVPSCDPEIDHDWLCPQCIEGFPHVDVDGLVAVCMHCARKLKRRSSKRKH
jgi:hypothetical protein